jgi:hypothetical protein
VGCAVVVGRAVEVGMLVAAGLAVCRAGCAGKGGSAESDEGGELPGSQPLAAATSSTSASAVTASNAPIPAPRPSARRSRSAVSAACLAASWRRRWGDQRGLRGCVFCCDQCEPGGLWPSRWIAASSCCQTVCCGAFGGAASTAGLVAPFLSSKRFAPCNTARIRNLGAYSLRIGLAIHVPERRRSKTSGAIAATAVLFAQELSLRHTTWQAER